MSLIRDRLGSDPAGDIECGYRYRRSLSGRRGRLPLRREIVFLMRRVPDLNYRAARDALDPGSIPGRIVALRTILLHEEVAP